MVVEAARAWATSGREAATADLLNAVEALEIERAGRTEGARVEQDITWGQLVEGDEVWSDKARKWFPVRSASRHVGQPVVIVDLMNVPKLLHRPIGDPVRVRRGTTGEAVDIFASVLWSGPRAGTWTREATEPVKDGE